MATLQQLRDIGGGLPTLIRDILSVAGVTNDGTRRHTVTIGERAYEVEQGDIGEGDWYFCIYVRRDGNTVCFSVESWAGDLRVSINSTQVLFTAQEQSCVPAVVDITNVQLTTYVDELRGWLREQPRTTSQSTSAPRKPEAKPDFGGEIRTLKDI